MATSNSAAKAAPRLDQRTRDALSAFLRDVKGLPNESAKTHRFIALVAELFPGSSAVTRLAEGIERLVRIDTGEALKRGAH